jgi:hypothetical protein
MHKLATKCNETLGKWCKNKHGTSKIVDTLETYQPIALAATMLVKPNLANMPARHDCVSGAWNANDTYRDTCAGTTCPMPQPWHGPHRNRSASGTCRNVGSILAHATDIVDAQLGKR